MRVGLAILDSSTEILSVLEGVAAWGAGPNTELREECGNECPPSGQLRALEVVWARRQGERWPAGVGWICTCRTCTPGRKLWPFAPATPGVPIGCQVCCNLPAGFKRTLALEGFLHSCRNI